MAPDHAALRRVSSQPAACDASHKRRWPLRRRRTYDAPIDGATYTFTADVWLHSGPGGWHFVTLPGDIADELDLRFRERHRPFGSLAVRVTIGETTWATSLFRDTKSESYLLPIKADVRRREHLRAGDAVTLTLLV